MDTISISKFKATCLSVIEEVRQTKHPVMVTKRGVPVAEIAPPPEEAMPGDWLGCMRGTVDIVGDIVEPVVEPGEWDASRD